MSKFYVVRINADGYGLVSTHESFAEAAKSAINGRKTCSVVVVRDGRSGKRYSVAELRAMQAAA